MVRLLRAPVDAISVTVDLTIHATIHIENTCESHRNFKLSKLTLHSYHEDNTVPIKAITIAKNRDRTVLSSVFIFIHCTWARRHLSFIYF